MTAAAIHPARTSPPQPSRRSPIALIAGVAYSLTWIAGLLLVSSSTSTRASGRDIVRASMPHATALTVQYLLTEGVTAIALAAVIGALWQAGRDRSGRPAAGGARSALLGAGLVACVLSLAEAGLGCYLIQVAVLGDHPAAAGSVSGWIDRLDGVKMLLLAIVAISGAVQIRRGTLAAPRWLGAVGLLLGLALTVSGLGYLALSNVLSLAAWVSLPLLLLWVTGAGLSVRTPGLRTRGD